MKHPIPFHYRIFLWRSWLIMFWIDLSGYLVGLGWSKNRIQSNECYTTIIDMAETHGVKPLDINVKFWLLMIAMFILCAFFLAEIYVKFYLDLIVV